MNRENEGVRHDTTAPARPPTPANRLGLDYEAEAERLGTPVRPIIDVHTHVNGDRASALFRRVMDLYGISRTYSQTQLAQADGVRRELGDRVRFIAIPEYMAEDKTHAFTDGFLENIGVWHREFGARCVKFWNAPRFRDLAQEAGLTEPIWELDNRWRVKAAERASELGMMFMAHIADPDTWFATAYKDRARYGAKIEHYAAFERMLDRFPSPWIGAHMGGWPEDLDFLTGLLDRHENLLLDTSATKWMIREISKHPSDRLITFLERFKGRILFGSDIVTIDEHLSADEDGKRFGAALANSEQEAFELYASRYWALRTMWETDYSGESPIADPDLAKLEPERYDAMSAPRLQGHAVDPSVLRALYGDAAKATVEAWYDARL